MSPCCRGKHSRILAPAPSPCWQRGAGRAREQVPVPAIQYTCYTLLWGRYLLYGHLGAVTGLATSSLGDLLVSVGQDRVAKLWRLAGAGAGHNNHNTLPLLQPVR